MARFFEPTSHPDFQGQRPPVPPGFPLFFTSPKFILKAIENKPHVAFGCCCCCCCCCCFFYSNEQTGTYRLTNLTTQITLCDISVTTSAIYIYYTTQILYFLTFLHSPKIFLLPLCCSVIQCRQKGCVAVIAKLLL